MNQENSAGARLSLLKKDDLIHIPSIQPEGWGDILPNFRFYASSTFCYVIKAEVGETLAGTGVAIFHENVAWLANIIVHPDYRNYGIGTQLTSHLLRHASANQKSVLLIATELGEPIYRKLGFTADGQYHFYERETVEPFTCSGLTPFDESHTTALLELDKAISGEKRRELFLPHLSSSRLLLDGKRLQGFCLPTLGEGLTLARTPEAGIELMKFNLSNRGRTVIPDDNEAAVRFVLNNGFEQVKNRTATKMYYGKKITWHPEKTFARIGGNMG